jgi:predicted hydrocarbon binding protein
MPALGALDGKDVAALDHLAVRLICLDSRFAPSLEQIGRLLGYRIAEQRHPAPVSFDMALTSLISSCGFESTVRFHFLRRKVDEALIQISGCSAALGWQIPRLERPVCTFDAALLEGFLRGATREQAWSVQETACLGFGNAACEFTVTRQSGPETGFQLEGTR